MMDTEEMRIADEDWKRAEAAGAIPYPRGASWQPKELPAGAVFLDHRGHRFVKDARTGELRRLRELEATQEIDTIFGIKRKRTFEAAK